MHHGTSQPGTEIICPQQQAKRQPQRSTRSPARTHPASAPRALSFALVPKLQLGNALVCEAPASPPSLPHSRSHRSALVPLKFAPNCRPKCNFGTSETHRHGTNNFHPNIDARPSPAVAEPCPGRFRGFRFRSLPHPVFSPSPSPPVPDSGRTRCASTCPPDGSR